MGLQTFWGLLRRVLPFLKECQNIPEHFGVHWLDKRHNMTLLFPLQIARDHSNTESVKEGKGMLCV